MINGAIDSIIQVLRPPPRNHRRSVLPLNYVDEAESDQLLEMDEIVDMQEYTEQDEQEVAKEFVTELYDELQKRYKRVIIYRDDVLFEMWCYEIEYDYAHITKYWVMPSDHPISNLLSYNYNGEPFQMYRLKGGILLEYTDDAVQWCLDMLVLMFREHGKELVETYTPADPLEMERDVTVINKKDA